MHPPLHLFTGFGVELEYMVVDAESLAVMPIVDRLLAAASGEEVTSDFDDGLITWSNELVNHVVEVKTNGPAESLQGLDKLFTGSLARIHELLRTMGGRLMPTGMHPWMNPVQEMQLWPHECNEVYRTFDDIFNCKGHGWANLQSVHLNLPFANDEEFGRLHAAIRLILPLLPALAASSPIMEGRITGVLDNRLDVYRSNCARIPSVTAKVIPERVFTRHDYEEQVFKPMFADVAPHDPEGVLREEWLNARGAIARFGRSTIEIRLIDVQECPAADLAICRLVNAILQKLTAESWSSLEEQQRWEVEPLYILLMACIRDAECAPVRDPAYLKDLGINTQSTMTAGQVWRHLAEATGLATDANLQAILEEGTLARRIITSVGPTPGHAQLLTTYRRLCNCVLHGELFVP